MSIIHAQPKRSILKGFAVICELSGGPYCHHVEREYVLFFRVIELSLQFNMSNPQSVREIHIECTRHPCAITLITTRFCKSTMEFRQLPIKT